MYKLSFILLMFLFCSLTNAQNYSVWFTNHTNNSPDPGTVIDGYGSEIYFSIGWSGTKANPQNKWKFYVLLDNPGNLVVSYDAWASEDSPSCSIGAPVNRSNTFSITMYEEDTNGNKTQRASSTCYFYVPATVYVANNFGSGTVKIAGSNQSCGAVAYVTGSVSIDIDNSQVDSENYTRIWNTSTYYQSDWRTSSRIISSSKSATYSYQNGENGTTITASMRRQCNLTSNAPLTYGGTTYSAGSNIVVTEGVPAQVTVQTSFVSSDYLQRQFTSWTDNNSTSATRTFYIYGHEEKDINSSVVKPDNGYKGMGYSGGTGDYITITWNEHPNSNVTQYQIWRKVKHNGVMGSAAQLGTVNRGTTSFTDQEYVYTSSYTDDLLYYDVRAYYQPNSSYASADFVAVYGRFASDPSMQNDNRAIGMQINTIPQDYKLGAYPNPFNPTTVIRYSMPEAGAVMLKVYNILSQEVASLVNETKAAGTHTINFNANNLPSGIYIARLQAGSKVVSIKLQLMK